MTSIDFKKNFLSHYALLEADFLETIKYVTIAQDNYGTYSAAYLKLLLTIGSEIDVVLEVLAKEYEPDNKESGFGCSKVILKHEPDMRDLKIAVSEADLIIKPWDGDGIPGWWTVYNETKHNRNEEAIKLNSEKKYYQFANQKNVLYALAGLFSLEMYAYRLLSKKHGEKLFVPTLKTIFSIKNSHWKDVTMGNGIVVLDGDMYIG